MLLFLLLCNVLCLPLIAGNTLKTTTTLPTKESHKIVDEPKTNTTKGIIASEGGAIIQNSPSLTLPNENHPNLPSYKEKGKSAVVSSNSKVVPRKGVVYIDDSISERPIKQDNGTDNSKIVEEKSGKELNSSKSTTVAPLIKSDIKDKKNSFNISSIPKKNIANTEKPKKPLVLLSVALANDEMQQKDPLSLPSIQSSYKTMTTDQMPSSAKENGPTTIIQPMSASRHPGMIMPVVITILVVPMFAVLGYMALRRGQEAWKNRHYKRMDFLLDGMYND